MNSIFTSMRSVINSGSMSIAQISDRIETMYIHGRLNSDERAELVELMYNKARPDAELGDYKKLYEALAIRFNELEARVAALEGHTDDGVDGEEVITYPAWRPWDGVSKDYEKGAVVIHNGTVWESVYDGQNVWEPGAVGIDERFWVVIPANSNEEE